MFIKTDVLGRPHWGIGGGLTSLRLAPALVFCPLCSSVCPHVAPSFHKTMKLAPPMYAGIHLQGIQVESYFQVIGSRSRSQEQKECLCIVFVFDD